MNTRPNTNDPATPQSAQSNPAPSAEPINAVDAALRLNLGLGDDADQNRARMQQAADFVQRVNDQYVAQKAGRPFARPHGKNARLSDLIARFLPQRSPWVAAGAGAGVFATIAVTAGLALWMTYADDQREALRGTTTAQTWRPAEPRAAVARLVGELHAAGCVATVAEHAGSLTVVLDLSVSPCNANQAGEGLLARYGLSADLKGRATIVVSPGR